MDFDYQGKFLFFPLCTEIVWVCRDWATLDIVLYGEENTYAKFGKESGLIICSHSWRSGLGCRVHCWSLLQILTRQLIVLVH